MSDIVASDNSPLPGAEHDPLRRMILAALGGTAGLVACSQGGNGSEIVDDESESRAIFNAYDQTKGFEKGEMDGTPWVATQTGNFDLDDPVQNLLARLKMTNNLIGPIGFVSAQVPGSSRVNGVELEANVTPTDWFDLTAGLSYNDVKFTDYAASGSVATNVLSIGANPGRQIGELFSSNGNRTRYVPKWRGSFTGKLAVNELIGMERAAWVILTGIVTGDFFIDNHNYQRVEGYWRFNARAGVDINDNYRVEIYGNNITNDLSYGNFGGTTTYFGSPNGDRRSFGPLPEKREIGIKFSAHF